MNLHDKIMNIKCDVDANLPEAATNNALGYKYGHRDARHAAAELALEAEAEIERLRVNAARYEWLRDSASWEAASRMIQLMPGEMDAAIDAAMEGKA